MAPAPPGDAATAAPGSELVVQQTPDCYRLKVTEPPPTGPRQPAAEPQPEAAEPQPEAAEPQPEAAEPQPEADDEPQQPADEEPQPEVADEPQASPAESQLRADAPQPLAAPPKVQAAERPRSMFMPSAMSPKSSKSWPAAPSGLRSNVKSSVFSAAGLLNDAVAAKTGKRAEEWVQDVKDQAFAKTSNFRSQINSQMDAALASHESGKVSALLDSAIAAKMMNSDVAPPALRRAAAQVASRQLQEAIDSEEPRRIKGALISAGRLNARHVPQFEQAAQAYQRLKQLPPGWNVSEMAQGRRGDKMVAKRAIEDGDCLARLQRLLDLTHRKVYTRDRMGEAIPEQLELVRAHAVSNDDLWANYMARREWIRRDAEKEAFKEYPVETVATIDPAPLAPGESAEEIASALAEEFDMMPLMKDVNEVFLWHGTSLQAADSITTSDFRLNLAGSNAGTLYGRGLYLAENASKSDEYTKPDTHMLRYMLLCRTTLGRAKYIDSKDANPRACEDACLKGDCHSILGDRKKARGTFREFVVFDEDQVYPNFILAYRRVASKTMDSAKTVAVKVPADAKLGDILSVQTPTGSTIQVQIPAGVKPGDIFQAHY